MPFCSNCGSGYQPPNQFCNSCGAALSNTPSVEREVEMDIGWGMDRVLRYRISLQRVLLMSVLSYGFYVFYWFYITWKQYRDHTDANAYPVWHALTLLVPIYGLFRTYAHMRSLKELMLNANLPSSISPGWAVLLVLVGEVFLNAEFAEFGTPTEDVLLAFVNIIGIASVSGLLFHVQRNLNRYWDGFTYMRADMCVASARIGVGEVIFGIIGAILWSNTLATVFG